MVNAHTPFHLRGLPVGRQPRGAGGWGGGLFMTSALSLFTGRIHMELDS